MSSRIVWIAAILFASSQAGAVAQDFWWICKEPLIPGVTEVDCDKEDWHDESRWLDPDGDPMQKVPGTTETLEPDPNDNVPDEDEIPGQGGPAEDKVYVTTSHADGLPSEDSADGEFAHVAYHGDFDENGDVLTRTIGSTYIGGWGGEFDEIHLPASEIQLVNGSWVPKDERAPLEAYEGFLEITGGHLKNWKFRADSDPGQPPCVYTRVGWRGATGRVLQTGGIFETCSGFGLNYISDQGFGSWRMTDGEMRLGGFTVGVQSSGVFEATGGKVSANNAVIGGGHNNRQTSYVPGMGAHFQRGGLLDAENSVVVGQFLGSSGSMAIQRNAEVDAKWFVVGRWGNGAVLQTGGDVSPAYSLSLGLFASGMGTYSIVDGVLNPRPSGYNTSVGIFNGRSGAGHLVIIGDRATVKTAGVYEQNSRSRLSFVLTEDGGNSVSTIQAGSASFEAGAQIAITYEGYYNHGSQGPTGADQGSGSAELDPDGLGWNNNLSYPITLVAVDSGAVDLGTTDPDDLQDFLSPEVRDDWRLVLYQNKLNAFYCPDASYTSGPCTW